MMSDTARVALYLARYNQNRENHVTFTDYFISDIFDKMGIGMGKRHRIILLLTQKGIIEEVKANITADYRIPNEIDVEAVRNRLGLHDQREITEYENHF